MNTQTELKREMEINGGYFAGIIRVDGKQYGVIVAPKDTGEFESSWGEFGKHVEGADHLNDGLANTQAMAEAGSTIANQVLALDINDCQDWYIPSRDELELLYRNLKPTDCENLCSFRDGENAHSVPQGGPHKPDSPAMTEAPGFQAGSPQSMADTWYWTSTQGSAGHAFSQAFSGGNQSINHRDRTRRVRAVRRFLID